MRTWKERVLPSPQQKEFFPHHHPINVQLINDYETKNYDHNFFRKDFREKIEFLELGPFRKLAKTFFSIKDINWIFYTNFLYIKA